MSEHDFRLINGTSIRCLYCGVEKWKTEPEEDCKIRERMHTRSLAKASEEASEIEHG